MAVATALKNGALDHILNGTDYFGSKVVKVVFHTQSTDPATGTFPSIHLTQHIVMPFGDVAAAGVKENSTLVEIANVQSANWGSSPIAWISIHNCAASGTTPSASDLILSIDISPDVTFSDGDTVQIAIAGCDVSIT
jgi:hypothetical protein